MIVRNFTPHAVDVYVVDAGEPVSSAQVGPMTVTFQPDPAGPARVSETSAPDRRIACEDAMSSFSIPVVRKVFGNGVNIPEPEPDTVFIVSFIVAQAYPERRDFVIPADFIRDEAGKIVACASFATCAI